MTINLYLQTGHVNEREILLQLWDCFGLGCQSKTK